MRLSFLLRSILVLLLCFLVEIGSFATVDKDVPIALLKQRQFSELDLLMNQSLDAYKLDTNMENDAATAFDSLSVREPNISHLFDEWIQAFPKSAAARFARGRYRYEIAWMTRGGRWISEVPQEKISGMETAIAQSIDDFRRACELDPKQALFSRYLIQAYMTVGKGSDIGKELLRAITLDPQVKGARYAYMRSLYPEWGGSYLQMEAFLTETKKSPDTPKMKKIKGDIESLLYLSKARAFYRDGDYEKTLVFANQAVSANRDQEGLTYVGFVLIKLNKHAEAILVLTEAINLSPKTADKVGGARDNRALAYKQLRQQKEAFDDYLILANAGHSYAQYFVGYAYTKGWGGIRQNQLDGIKWLSLATDGGNESAKKLLLEIKQKNTE